MGLISTLISHHDSNNQRADTQRNADREFEYKKQRDAKTDQIAEADRMQKQNAAQEEAANKRKAGNYRAFLMLTDPDMTEATTGGVNADHIRKNFDFEAVGYEQPAEDGEYGYDPDSRTFSYTTKSGKTQTFSRLDAAAGMAKLYGLEYPAKGKGTGTESEENGIGPDLLQKTGSSQYADEETSARANRSLSRQIVASDPTEQAILRKELASIEQQIADKGEDYDTKFFGKKTLGEKRDDILSLLGEYDGAGTPANKAQNKPVQPATKKDTKVSAQMQKAMALGVDDLQAKIAAAKKKNDQEAVDFFTQALESKQAE